MTEKEFIREFLPEAIPQEDTHTQFELALGEFTKQVVSNMLGGELVKVHTLDLLTTIGAMVKQVKPDVSEEKMAEKKAFMLVALKNTLVGYLKALTAE